MSDVVIRVENLSKKYQIRRANGHSSGEGLRHVIQDAVTAPARWLHKAVNGYRKSIFRGSDAPQLTDSSYLTTNKRTSINNKQNSDVEFLALKDVSFEIKRGEVVGIIGRNGAGKSTLLKILSRITEPSSGRIGIKGRVASLLEVGTGFHPELTGRENIFLNGAILGMTRAEVIRKFDEIVDFSGVEKFLDTPVKRYSSGMYVRLAFAVAAHLDPEILIIDEVLAVGDAEFQKKCLGKMQDVAGGGRTVLFVSHNMPSVTALCSRAILLKNGTVDFQGEPSDVVPRYLRHPTDTNQQHRLGSGELRLTHISVNPQFGAPHLNKEIECHYVRKNATEKIVAFLIIEILNEYGEIIARCDTRLAGKELDQQKGSCLITLRSPWLKPGSYSVNATIDSGSGFIDVWERAANLQISGELPYNRVVSMDTYKTGSVLSDFKCELNDLSSK